MSFHILTIGLEQFQRIRMTLETRNWWNTIPSSPGWYLIETNTPIATLSKLTTPPQGSNIYNIPERIAFNAWLNAQGLMIAPSEPDASYFVYSGEQANLKSRAREHTHGNHGTGCLCLSHYQQLWDFQWWFWYLPCDTVFPRSNGNKALRILGEQTWRAQNGWPALCKE